MKHDDDKTNDIKKSKTKDDLEKEILKDDPHYKLPTNIVTWPNNPEPIEIIIEKLSKIISKNVNWLWPDVIAFGKTTLFAGEPGVGKSQLLLYIASILSNGYKFHFQPIKINAQNILIMSGEDNAEDTIKPRLEALNANIERIDFVKGIKRLDKNGNEYFDAICVVEHIADLEQKIIDNKYKLIIIDPISLYLGSIDEHKNKEIRKALNILEALAHRHDLAIILNSHFTKPTGNGNKSAIYRVMGSVGFAAAARIVFGIMKDPDNADRRLFLPIKNNLGQDKQGFVYEIKPITLENNIFTSKIEWLNEKIDATANDILNPPLKIESPKLETAKDLLTNLLKKGPILLSEIRKKFTEQGFSIDRLYAAKSALNIIEDQEIGGSRIKFWKLSS